MPLDQVMSSSTGLPVFRHLLLCLNILGATIAHVNILRSIKIIMIHVIRTFNLSQSNYPQGSTELGTAIQVEDGGR